MQELDEIKVRWGVNLGQFGLVKEDKLVEILLDALVDNHQIKKKEIVSTIEQWIDRIENRIGFPGIAFMENWLISQPALRRKIIINQFNSNT